ncbi:hypothetical protein [Rhodovulum sulfidophilum]|nr:hypothetical protein [Rhodovulum sulfidophilum]
MTGLNRSAPALPLLPFPVDADPRCGPRGHMDEAGTAGMEV